ncbi:MAG: CRISPR-associated helicase Cas3' [Xanthomonadales bacterium]|nr:CRISPR-associated helicase Cas3' [Xanthomonadales bacterium]
MEFDRFFVAAFGKGDESALVPYPYQRALAEQDWPSLLDVPTGMGKTAAVTLAWLWKRGWRIGGREGDVDSATPRRLVWCLPMRVLVEQTADNIQQWLERLGLWGKLGEGRVSVHVLMGGEDDLKSWAEFPEEDMILIGTQDMLLSRALMRGYGMSRYQWPIHFALLHNDCLWVFDEVQLMGAGLAASAQLEAFRRDFPLARDSHTLWVSATLNRGWLATVDLRAHLPSLPCVGVGDEDRRQAGDRLRAVKTLERAPLSLTSEAGNKAGLKDYLARLCDLVLEVHDVRSQTLVIVNNVDRAQQLFRLLRERRGGQDDLLVHARFRAAERTGHARRLREADTGNDRIVVATQAIEAGVDISSRALVTELAPWSSMAQRFGRCNRYGEYNTDGARILWVDVEGHADLARPYSPEELAFARSRLEALDSASPDALPRTDNERPLTAVLRRRDLLDLFNTDPDLSGFDVDVSDYIRDSGLPSVQVFWRDFRGDPNDPSNRQLAAGPPELCPVSITQARAFFRRKDVILWRWDTLDGRWVKVDRDPRPGMTLLAHASAGGYDRDIGFDPGITRPLDDLPSAGGTVPQRDFKGDWRSQQSRPVALAAHLRHVAQHADRLCAMVEEVGHRDSIVRAGRWHDLGKLHEVFQHSMYRCRLPADPARPLAKSSCSGPMHHKREYFRHELASMLAWLDQHEGEPEADLIAYLILAHHGKVRTSLRAMPGEAEHIPPGTRRFARGIHEGDSLPALDFDGEHSAQTSLRLALMEIGEGEQGPSWTERVLRLLDQHGPFRLAWLETLVRLADWRASAAEQEDTA